MLIITRKGVTPVEWCNCNQYEIRLKPRRVPVIIKPKITIIGVITTILMFLVIVIIQPPKLGPNVVIIITRLASLVSEETTQSPQGRSTWTTSLAGRLVITTQPSF